VAAVCSALAAIASGSNYFPTLVSVTNNYCYTITSLGSTTAAQWAALGAGNVAPAMPVLGTNFTAIVSTTVPGSGAVSTITAITTQNVLLKVLSGTVPAVMPRISIITGYDSTVNTGVVLGIQYGALPVGGDNTTVYGIDTSVSTLPIAVKSGSGYSLQIISNIINGGSGYANNQTIVLSNIRFNYLSGSVIYGYVQGTVTITNGVITNFVATGLVYPGYRVLGDSTTRYAINTTTTAAASVKTIIAGYSYTISSLGTVTTVDQWAALGATIPTLTSVTSGVKYTIAALGSTTAAQWATLGVPAGTTAIQGIAFTATSTSSIPGTGLVTSSPNVTFTASINGTATMGDGTVGYNWATGAGLVLNWYQIINYGSGYLPGLQPQIYSNVTLNTLGYYPNSIVGTITGTTLSISQINNSTLTYITAGFYLSDANGVLLPNTQIIGQATGTGGLGTYTINNSQNVASITMSLNNYSMTTPTTLPVVDIIVSEGMISNVYLVTPPIGSDMTCKYQVDKNLVGGNGGGFSISNYSLLGINQYVYLTMPFVTDSTYMPNTTGHAAINFVSAVSTTPTQVGNQLVAWGATVSTNVSESFIETNTNYSGAGAVNTSPTPYPAINTYILTIASPGQGYHSGNYLVTQWGTGTQPTVPLIVTVTADRLGRLISVDHYSGGSGLDNTSSFTVPNSVTPTVPATVTGAFSKGGFIYSKNTNLIPYPNSYNFANWAHNPTTTSSITGFTSTGLQVLYPGVRYTNGTYTNVPLYYNSGSMYTIVYADGMVIPVSSTANITVGCHIGTNSVTNMYSQYLNYDYPYRVIAVDAVNNTITLSDAIGNKPSITYTLNQQYFVVPNVEKAASSPYYQLLNTITLNTYPIVDITVVNGSIASISPNKNTAVTLVDNTTQLVLPTTGINPGLLTGLGGIISNTYSGSGYIDGNYTVPLQLKTPPVGNLVTFGNFVPGVQYIIKSLSTVDLADWVVVGAAPLISANQIVAGNTYYISIDNTPSFTTCGASSTSTGTVFTATKPITGSGLVYAMPTVGSIFTAISAGGTTYTAQTNINVGNLITGQYYQVSGYGTNTSTGGVTTTADWYAIGACNVTVSIAAVSINNVYVISSVGTTTLAQWQSIGYVLPIGSSAPAIGDSFISTSGGNTSLGSGQVYIAPYTSRVFQATGPGRLSGGTCSLIYYNTNASLQQIIPVPTTPLVAKVSVYGGVVNTVAIVSGNSGWAGNNLVFTIPTTLGSFTGGNSYTDGTYSNVQLSWFSGTTTSTYPTVNVTVVNGIVTKVGIVTYGSGFTDLTTVMTFSLVNLVTGLTTGTGFTVMSASLLGGTGSGFYCLANGLGTVNGLTVTNGVLPAPTNYYTKIKSSLTTRVTSTFSSGNYTLSLSNTSFNLLTGGKNYRPGIIKITNYLSTMVPTTPLYVTVVTDNSNNVTGVYYISGGLNIDQSTVFSIPGGDGKCTVGVNTLGINTTLIPNTTYTLSFYVRWADSLTNGLLSVNMAGNANGFNTQMTGTIPYAGPNYTFSITNGGTGYISGIYTVSTYINGVAPTIPLVVKITASATGVVTGLAWYSGGDMTITTTTAFSIPGGIGGTALCTNVVDWVQLNFTFSTSTSVLNNPPVINITSIGYFSIDLYGASLTQSNSSQPYIEPYMFNYYLNNTGIFSDGFQTSGHYPSINIVSQTLPNGTKLYNTPLFDNRLLAQTNELSPTIFSTGNTFAAGTFNSAGVFTSYYTVVPTGSTLSDYITFVPKDAYYNPSNLNTAGALITCPNQSILAYNSGLTLSTTMLTTLVSGVTYTISMWLQTNYSAIAGFTLSAIPGGNWTKGIQTAGCEGNMSHPSWQVKNGGFNIDISNIQNIGAALDYTCPSAYISPSSKLFSRNADQITSNPTHGCKSIGSFTGGNSYTDGTYSNVQLSWFSGTTTSTYPTVNVTVIGGVVVQVILNTLGTGFSDTTTLMVLNPSTAPAGLLTGGGFSIGVEAPLYSPPGSLKVYDPSEILQTNSFNGGSGYTPGTYYNVPLTLLSGTAITTYPTVNIIVNSSGAVSQVILINGGSGFTDYTTQMSCSPAMIGGTGSGFSIGVASSFRLAPCIPGVNYTPGTYNGVTLSQINDGSYSPILIVNITVDTTGVVSSLSLVQVVGTLAPIASTFNHPAYPLNYIIAPNLAPAGLLAGGGFSVNVIFTGVMDSSIIAATSGTYVYQEIPYNASNTGYTFDAFLLQGTNYIQSYINLASLPNNGAPGTYYNVPLQYVAGIMPTNTPLATVIINNVNTVTGLYITTLPTIPSVIPIGSGVSTPITNALARASSSLLSTTVYSISNSAIGLSNSVTDAIITITAISSTVTFTVTNPGSGYTSNINPVVLPFVGTSILATGLFLNTVASGGSVVSVTVAGKWTVPAGITVGMQLVVPGNKILINSTLKYENLAYVTVSVSSAGAYSFSWMAGTGYPPYATWTTPLTFTGVNTTFIVTITVNSTGYISAITKVSGSLPIGTSTNSYYAKIAHPYISATPLNVGTVNYGVLYHLTDGTSVTQLSQATALTTIGNRWTYYSGWCNPTYTLTTQDTTKPVGMGLFLGGTNAIYGGVRIQATSKFVNNSIVAVKGVWSRVSLTFTATDCFAITAGFNAQLSAFNNSPFYTGANSITLYNAVGNGQPISNGSYYIYGLMINKGSTPDVYFPDPYIPLSMQINGIKADKHLPGLPTLTFPKQNTIALTNGIKAWDDEAHHHRGINQSYMTYYQVALNFLNLLKSGANSRINFNTDPVRKCNTNWPYSTNWAGGIALNLYSSYAINTAGSNYTNGYYPNIQLSLVSGKSATGYPSVNLTIVNNVIAGVEVVTPGIGLDVTTIMGINNALLPSNSGLLTGSGFTITPGNMVKASSGYAGQQILKRVSFTAGSTVITIYDPWWNGGHYGEAGGPFSTPSDSNYIDYPQIVGSSNAPVAITSNNGFSGTGFINLNILTILTVNTGTINVGDIINGTGVTQTTITSIVSPQFYPILQGSVGIAPNTRILSATTGGAARNSTWGPELGTMQLYLNKPTLTNSVIDTTQLVVGNYYRVGYIGTDNWDHIGTRWHPNDSMAYHSADPNVTNADGTLNIFEYIEIDVSPMIINGGTGYSYGLDKNSSKAVIGQTNLVTNNVIIDIVTWCVVSSSGSIFRCRLFNFLTELKIGTSYTIDLTNSNSGGSGSGFSFCYGVQLNNAGSGYDDGNYSAALYANGVKTNVSALITVLGGIVYAITILSGTSSFVMNQTYTVALGALNMPGNTSGTGFLLTYIGPFFALNANNYPIYIGMPFQCTAIGNGSGTVTSFTPNTAGDADYYAEYAPYSTLDYWGLDDDGYPTKSPPNPNIVAITLLSRLAPYDGSFFGFTTIWTPPYIPIGNYILSYEGVGNCRIVDPLNGITVYPYTLLSTTTVNNITKKVYYIDTSSKLHGQDLNPTRPVFSILDPPSFGIANGGVGYTTTSNVPISLANCNNYAPIEGGGNAVTWPFYINIVAVNGSITSITYASGGGQNPDGTYCVNGNISFNIPGGYNGSGFTLNPFQVTTPSGIYIGISNVDPYKTGNYVKNIKLYEQRFDSCMYVPVSNLIYKKLYQIESLGTTTQAEWVSVGLKPLVTAVVGTTFISNGHTLSSTGVVSEIFYPQFIDRLKDFKCIRFLEWGGANKLTIGTQLQNNIAQIPKMTHIAFGSNGNAVPPELMANFCNLIQRDCWMPVVCWSSDRKAFYEHLAKIYYTVLDPNLRLYLEFGNEAWNSGFPTYKWLSNALYGLYLYKALNIAPDNGAPGYAMYPIYSMLVFNTFENVFSGDKYLHPTRLYDPIKKRPRRLNRCCAAQMTNISNVSSFFYGASFFVDSLYNIPYDCIASAGYYQENVGVAEYDAFSQTRGIYNGNNNMTFDDVNLVYNTPTPTVSLMNGYNFSMNDANSIVGYIGGQTVLLSVLSGHDYTPGTYTNIQLLYNGNPPNPCPLVTMVVGNTGAVTSITVTANQSALVYGLTYTVNDNTATSSATSMHAGTRYTIASIGTTDFTAYGASANTVGLVFTATAQGTGTGTVSAGVLGLTGGGFSCKCIGSRLGYDSDGVPFNPTYCYYEGGFATLLSYNSSTPSAPTQWFVQSNYLTHVQICCELDVPASNLYNLNKLDGIEYQMVIQQTNWVQNVMMWLNGVSNVTFTIIDGGVGNAALLQTQSTYPPCGWYNNLSTNSSPYFIGKELAVLPSSIISGTVPTTPLYVSTVVDPNGVVTAINYIGGGANMDTTTTFIIPDWGGGYGVGTATRYFKVTNGGSGYGTGPYTGVVLTVNGVATTITATLNTTSVPTNSPVSSTVTTLNITNNANLLVVGTTYSGVVTVPGFTVVPFTWTYLGDMYRQATAKIATLTVNKPDNAVYNEWHNTASNVGTNDQWGLSYNDNITDTQYYALPKPRAFHKTAGRIGYPALTLTNHGTAYTSKPQIYTSTGWTYISNIQMYLNGKIQLLGGNTIRYWDGKEWK